MKVKQTRILRTPEELKTIISLLEKYPLTEWEGEVDTFIKFGYMNITDGAKSTFSVFRSLGMNAYMKNKNNEFRCQVSYEFLATALHTSIRTQIRRVKELIDAELLYVIKQGANANIYDVMYRPSPDSTFEITLRRLILRRECINLLHNIKDKSLLHEYPEEHKRLSKMFKSPFCKELILSRAAEFNTI